MDEERGTQREIAKSYRDRVQSRFTRTVWRSARFLLSVVLFAGGVVAIYYCEKEKPQEFFNTGPLSRSHAHLQNGCVSCHVPERLTSSSAGQPPGFFQVLNDPGGCPAELLVRRSGTWQETQPFCKCACERESGPVLKNSCGFSFSQ